jgi:hypothetical protein
LAVDGDSTSQIQSGARVKYDSSVVDDRLDLRDRRRRGPPLGGSTVFAHECLAHLGHGAPVAQLDAEKSECRADELER